MFLFGVLVGAILAILVMASVIHMPKFVKNIIGTYKQKYKVDKFLNQDIDYRTAKKGSYPSREDL